MSIHFCYSFIYFSLLEPLSSQKSRVCLVFIIMFPLLKHHEAEALHGLAVAPRQAVHAITRRTLPGLDGFIEGMGIWQGSNIWDSRDIWCIYIYIDIWILPASHVFFGVLQIKVYLYTYIHNRRLRGRELGKFTFWFTQLDVSTKNGHGHGIHEP